MIRINDTFSASRDQNGWTLYEAITVKSKDTKKPKIGGSRTYWSNLTQVCKAVIDKTAGESTGEAQDVIRAIASAHEDLSLAIKRLPAEFTKREDK